MGVMRWPQFFVPQRDDAGGAPCAPQHVLDMFFVQPGARGPDRLIAVVACIGGGIAAIPEARFDQLGGALGQALSVQVSQRERFRRIVAPALFLFAAEAVEQQTQLPGHNDALNVLGSLRGDVLADVAADLPGNLKVGALDFLFALREGLAKPFANPHEHGRRIFHLLLPGDARAAECVLAYPTIPADAVASPDNTAVTMRMAHATLARMQQELRESDSTNVLATALLPVPNRQALEDALQGDGYKIDGDIAIQVGKRAGQGASSQQAGSWLDRLRAFASEWAAPRIALPPQAEPADYVRWIDHILQVAAQPADRAMHAALAGSVLWGQRAAQSAAATSGPPKKTQRTPRAAQPQRGATPRAWADDFDSPVTPKRTSGEDQGDWENDFGS